MNESASLFRIPDFRLLWTGQVVSQFGDALTNLALLLAAERLTGSTAVVAATAVAIALPQLLFGLVAGVYVDRWNRRRVMIVSDLVRAVLVLGFVAVTGPERIWLMYVVAFAQAGVGTFFNPAKTALLPDVVGRDHLLQANSVSETARVLVGVAGTAVAGFVVAIAGVVWPAFVMDAATFVASAILISRMRVNGAPPVAASEGRPLAEVFAGLRILAGSRALVGVLVAGSVVMLGLGAVNVLLVPFVTRTLALPASWFGALEGAQVVSMVLAGALVTGFAARLRPATLIVGGLVGIGATVVSIGQVHGVWQLMAALFVVGWFVTPVQSSVSTMLQEGVPAAALGRAGATLSTLLTLANVVSMAASGAAAAALGVRGVFVAAGGVALIAALAAGITFRTATRPAPAQA